MVIEKSQNSNNISYLGLDIGTDSVGWAVTDDKYNLKKFKNNLMWGVSLFDSANQAVDRRKARSARRRLDRKKQRISLLQSLFEEEIMKIDPKFLLRLKESYLYPEDSKNRTFNIFFDDKSYNDKDYYKEYPTIHHLICDLIENKKSSYDIRLVYLACSYLLSHRGHFLLEVDKDKIEDIKGGFKKLYDDFLNCIKNLDYEIPFESDENNFSNVLKMKINITSKEKEFYNILFDGKKPKEKEDYPINLKSLVKLICGGNVKLSDLFKNEDYIGYEENAICISNSDFGDKINELSSFLEDEDKLNLILSIKKMYDWALLNDILNEKEFISKAKVEIYNVHKYDLHNLKKIVKKYVPEKYYEIFKKNKKDNYVSYSYNFKSFKGDDLPSKCSQEDFCKYIKKCIENIKVEEVDNEIYEDIISKIDNRKLCPKQVTSDNRVIPYQLYYYELKLILENAEKYLPFLKEFEKFSTGEISTKDKILSLMTFKIPYYVGPLVTKEKSKNAWLERKAEGKIYPWNFDEIVDKDKCEEEFIRRMTRKCTYLAGEDVLPKYALIYSKFCVLNEINNLKINAESISPELKQIIYDKFFNENKKKVTKKGIKKFLILNNYMDENDELTGIDDNIKSSLKSYHDFKEFLISSKLNESQVERIIERITITTDKKRLIDWLKKEFKKLSDIDIKRISNLNYKEYGRLSRKFLEDTEWLKDECLEKNIITMLWDTNENLQQLLQ